MIGIAIGCAVGVVIALVVIGRGWRTPVPVVELTEWQAVSTADLSTTLDGAFTRF